VTKDEVLNFIADIEDRKECAEIARTARECERAITVEELKREINEFWRRVIWLRSGGTVYCCGSDLFLVALCNRATGRRFGKYKTVGAKCCGWKSVKAERVNLSGFRHVKHFVSAFNGRSQINELSKWIGELLTLFAM
jgi:hypothetical protein